MDFVLFLLCVVGIAAFVRYWPTIGRSRSGSLRVGGMSYPYLLGDNLPRYGIGTGDRFRGIDIELPKEFPHIYLDAHPDDRMTGPRYFFDPRQRLRLEGDFDRTFHAYVPKGYHVLALSVLSPDVLVTLLDHSERYDVELYGSHLRLLSRRRVYGRAAAEADIIRAAGKVLTEVDHRLQSWRDQDSKDARDASLRLQDNQTLKVGRWSLRTSTLLALIGFGAAGSVFYVPALYIGSDPNRPHDGLWLLVLAGFLAFPCAFVVTFIFIRRSYLRSRA